MDCRVFGDGEYERNSIDEKTAKLTAHDRGCRIVKDLSILGEQPDGFQMLEIWVAHGCTDGYSRFCLFAGSNATAYKFFSVSDRPNLNLSLHLNLNLNISHDKIRD